MTWNGGKHEPDPIFRYSPNVSARSYEAYWARAGRLMLQITNGHYLYETQWAMACKGLGIGWMPLEAKDGDTAKIEALKTVKDSADQLMVDYIDLADAVKAQT